jgi:UDP-3-O-[3-hydroxymyristoyl] glucosamine N-acyltransferase
MEKTLGELAAMVGGAVRGDAAMRIRAAATIEEAEPGDLTFVANPKYAPKAAETRASALVVAPGFQDVGKPLLEVANPYAAFARLIGVLMPRRPAPPAGVSPGAFVAATAQLGRDCAVMAQTFIDDEAVLGDRIIVYPQVFIGRGAVIGDDCVFFPGVRIYDGTQIGRRVTVHANSVVGADGFGFAPEEQHYVPIPQVGRAIIGDDVYIGCNVTVNRGALGDTRVGRGCKIDSNVVVAHNVVVGEDTVLVAQVGISGSSKIGRHCTLAGQVGVTGHVEIGDNATIGAQSGVIGSLKGDTVYLGSPAMPIDHARRVYVVFTNLPDIAKDVKELKRRLKGSEG